MGSILQSAKERCIDSVYADAIKRLKQFEEDLTFVKRPDALEDYTRYLQTLSKLLVAAEGENISFDVTKIKQLLEDDYANAINEFMQREVAINNKYEDKVSSTVEAIKTEVAQHNLSVQKELETDNQIYLLLEKKRLELETYKDVIIDTCASYGVTSSDINIDNSTFTVKELNDLYNEYLEFLGKPGNRMNVVAMLRERVSSPLAQGAILLLILASAFTFALDFVAIGFIVMVIQRQLKVKSNMKYYAVLQGLLFNVRPLEMGFKDKVDPNLLIPEDVNVESDSIIQSVADEWANELSQLDGNSPVEQLDAERIELVNSLQSYIDEVEKLTNAFKEEKSTIVSRIQKLILDGKDEFEKLKSNVKLLGDEIQKSAVFSTKFKLGLRDSVIEEVYDIGLSNILIKPSEDVELQKRFLQVLLANAFCNVKVTNLSVTVYDPNKFGQDLVSFFDEDIERLIEFKNGEFDKIIEDHKVFAAKNLKDMRGLDINSFNAKAEQVGRTPKEYKLLIVLSQPKTIEENEALTEFMRYSANLGVFVWCLSEKKIPDTKYFAAPFAGVRTPYDINTEEFGGRVVKTLITAKKESETEALAWKTFIDVAIPDAKIWTGVTDQFLDLLPGFCDGDPTQFNGYTVGNEGNVHIIGVGGTGAGKSVFLNHLIATMTKEYSPREVELWMVDFKGSEFSFYLSKKEHPKMLPHIKACLCTSDGDYAGSLFTALRKTAEQRYKLLMDKGFKNIKEYNKYLRANGKADETIPRILFINDEFQVIFEKAEPKIVEQITKDITYIAKVARACGVHIFFTSQSMKNTIKDDILQQFTLRFALRCDEEVSTTILGTKYASNIKQKFGYLYVRSVEDQSLESQKRYRTPFLSDDVLREHINRMADLAVERNMPKRDVISYEETTVHPIAELSAFYEHNKGKVPKSGLIMLGNRMTYSSNKAPDNVVLSAENNSHIFSVFSSTTDVVNFFRTMLTNIRSHEANSTIFINSQIADLHYVCEIEKEVPEEQLTLSNEKKSIVELYAMFEAIYNMRVHKGMKEDPAYFILLGWDKADGFGIDKDSGYAAAMAKLLQLCGEYNMHFIFINTDVASIGTNVINACKYKICGKCSEDASYKLLDSKQGCKIDDNMKDGYMYINRAGEVSRAKLYRTNIEREIKQSVFVLE